MNLYPLITYLAAGKFITGTQLGKHLNISRTAIWKQVQQLEGIGLDIIVNKQQGYRLAKPLSLLDANVIQQHLTEQNSSLKLSLFPSIDSTNLEAKRQLTALNGKQEKLLVLTEMQTAGKGRRGKNWVSPFGQNLALSLGFKLDVDIAKLQGLSLAIAVELNACIEELGGSNLGFKWPNDVYLNNKKLAGILVEVSGDFSGPFNLIIGVGLNLHSTSGFKQIDQSHAFLEDILPKINRNLLAANLAIKLEKLLDKFVITGFEPWQESWNNKHLWQNKSAVILNGANLNNIDNAAQEVTLGGVNEFGELEVITSQGEHQVINSGEVSLRLVK